jgi:hypothetical protein
MKITMDQLKLDADLRMQELARITTWKADNEQQMPDELAKDEAALRKLEDVEGLGDKVGSMNSDIPEALSQREYASEMQALAVE